MEILSSFSSITFTPMVAPSNPAMKAYLQDRVWTEPSAYPVIGVQSAESDETDLPSHAVLHEQLRFEGVSPLEVERLISRARGIEEVGRRTTALDHHLRRVTANEWLRQETNLQRLGERKSRVARWWRASSRHLLVWSAVASACLLVATTLVAREGSSFRPLIGFAIALLIALATFAALTAWHEASTAASEETETEPPIWIQSIIATELAAAQTSIGELEGDISNHLNHDADSLRELTGRLSTAKRSLDETLLRTFWIYKARVESARAAAHTAKSPRMVEIADTQIVELESHSAAFSPALSQESDGLRSLNQTPSRNFRHDRVVAVALAAVFALVVTPVILGLPSLAIANDKCSYAVAQVRIDACDDLRELDASNLNLAGIDLEGRDVSQSDFTSSVFSDAQLSDANFTFANVDSANFADASASASTWRGASAVDTRFTGADLSRADLSEADLTGADFADAKLQGADLSGSIASGASFTAIDGDSADFTLTDLASADMSEASLTAARLVDANLSGAILDNTDLSDADLSGAILRGVDLSQAELTGATLDGADLSGTDLSGLDLSGLSLAGADLSGSNLTDATLSDANLLGANLMGATITGLTLSGASLGGVSVKALLDGGADLSNVDLSGADLSGLAGAEINLPGATLDGVDLSGYDLRGAILDGASLVGATLDGSTMIGASFTEADLTDASFAVAEMSEATFTGALFNRADMTDVRALDSDFQGAGFAGTNLDGADFSGSNMENARGLSQNAARAQWVGATCPNGQKAEICRS